MKNNYSFVKHGKTKFNEEGIFMGTLDIPLSQNGVQQALALGTTFDPHSFDVVYSSPLLRAYHTGIISLGMAKPILSEYEDSSKESYVLIYPDRYVSPKGKLFIVDPMLAERNFGNLQGHPRKDYTEKFLEYKGRADLELKLRHFFNEVESQYENKNILVFSHNGPIRIARKYFEGLSEEETLKISNPHCELIQFEDRRKKWQI